MDIACHIHYGKYSVHCGPRRPFLNPHHPPLCLSLLANKGGTVSWWVSESASLGIEFELGLMGDTHSPSWTSKQINSSWKCNFSISGMLLSASHPDCRIINWNDRRLPPRGSAAAAAMVPWYHGSGIFAFEMKKCMAKICHDKWHVITLLFTEYPNNSTQTTRRHSPKRGGCDDVLWIESEC